jgi:hypothetical protein
MTKCLISVGWLTLAAIVCSAPAHAKPTGCWAWCYRHGDSPACYRECDQTNVTNKASVVRKGNTTPVRREGVHR